MVFDERDVVNRARSYDPEAFGELYDRYFDRIYSYVFYRVGSRPDAEDITEQVFLNALNAIDKFTWTGAPFSAWLFQIARNALTDYFRSETRKGVAMERKKSEASTGPQTGPSAESEAVEHLTQERLAEALGRLTEDQRQVILLKFFANLSNKEIGDVLGKPEGAVKSLQHRALVALAKIVGTEYGRNR